MSVLYVLLPLALLFAVSALIAFVWATRGGQFDDLQTPAVRILHDDEDDVGERAAEASDEQPERNE
ncbi:MAG: cbb3-type cytochrome oxidase assembly protein CcoS [Planctomycetota bacterium]